MAADRGDGGGGRGGHGSRLFESGIAGEGELCDRVKVAAAAILSCIGYDHTEH